MLKQTKTFFDFRHKKLCKLHSPLKMSYNSCCTLSKCLSKGRHEKHIPFYNLQIIVYHDSSNPKWLDFSLLIDNQRAIDYLFKFYLFILRDPYTLNVFFWRFNISNVSIFKNVDDFKFSQFVWVSAQFNW